MLQPLRLKDHVSITSFYTTLFLMFICFVLHKVDKLKCFFWFQNVRPSAENLPEELALILTSCWQEDPNARPNFTQIIQMLLNYLYTVAPPEPMIPSRIFTSENTVLPPESPGTSSLMAKRDDTGDTPRAKDEVKPNGFLCCFSQCY